MNLVYTYRITQYQSNAPLMNLIALRLRFLCIEDLKGEVGENPARSRHCKQGVLFKSPRLKQRIDGEENDDLKPGNLP